MDIIVPFVKVDPEALTPTQANPTDAGYDLSSRDEHIILPGERRLVATGLSIALPANTYLRIAPRSGLAYKHGIDVLAGVVDAGYRGKIGVILINFGSEPFVIKPGDRIAQGIIEACHSVTRQEVATVEELPSSERGASGYGHSGVAAKDLIFHPPVS